MDAQAKENSNYLKNAEIEVEQNYDGIDGIINNVEDVPKTMDKPSIKEQLSQMNKEVAKTDDSIVKNKSKDIEI